MYAYCGNNPISRADYEGEWFNVVFGAMGYEGTEAFEESMKIVSNTTEAIGKLIKKELHPKVRAVAKKTVKQAYKYLKKEAFNSVTDNVSTTILANFISDISGLYIKAFD